LGLGGGGWDTTHLLLLCRSLRLGRRRVELPLVAAHAARYNAIAYFF
jgi:hypothetical protein